MIDTIYYFWSTTCPWCSKVEHFIKVLELHGFKIVKVSIDENAYGEALDFNLLFTNIVGLGDQMIAPLFVIEYKKGETTKYLYIPIHGKKDKSVDEEKIARDVAKLVLSFLLALNTIGVDTSKLVEDKIVQKMVKPILQQPAEQP